MAANVGIADAEVWGLWAKLESMVYEGLKGEKSKL